MVYLRHPVRRCAPVLPSVLHVNHADVHVRYHVPVHRHILPNHKPADTHLRGAYVNVTLACCFLVLRTERESEREKGIQTTSVHQFSAPIFLLITNYIYKFDYFLLLLFRLREVFE